MPLDGADGSRGLLYDVGLGVPNFSHRPRTTVPNPVGPSGEVVAVTTSTEYVQRTGSL
jgi:hypothetical protein